MRRLRLVDPRSRGRHPPVFKVLSITVAGLAQCSPKGGVLETKCYVGFTQGRIYLLVGPRPNSSVGHSCMSSQKSGSSGIYVTVNLYNQVICILPDVFSYVYYLFHSAEKNRVIFMLPEIYFTNLYRLYLKCT